MSANARLRAIAKKVFERKIPAHLQRNFTKTDELVLAKVRASLERNYFADKPPDYLSTTFGREDLEFHMSRVTIHREWIAPWLDEAKPLRGSRILEIGCGTAASTVVLAEQGAEVIGVDIDDKSLVVAEDRCKAFGVKASFRKANATEVHSMFRGERFDFILFFAALEHMTHEERLASMNSTWDMLAPDGLWCVIDTPNRLWYFDAHTSRLPFFNWLPDDVAFKYSRFSNRPHFAELYREPTEAARLHFLRRGRGASFHEFDLTFGPASKLDVVSSLYTHLRGRNILRALAWKMSTNSSYKKFLMNACPGIHEGFFELDLNLIIRKH